VFHQSKNGDESDFIYTDNSFHRVQDGKNRLNEVLHGKCQRGI
jgi:hypothetical protein